MRREGGKGREGEGVWMERGKGGEGGDVFVCDEYLELWRYSSSGQ